MRTGICLILVAGCAVDPSSGTTPPPSCSGAACTMQGAVMIGGRSGLTDTVPLPDIWSWSGAAWSQLQIDAVPGRPQCVGVANGQVFAYTDVVTGAPGPSGVLPNTLEYDAWNGSSWTPTPAPPTAADFTNGTGPTTSACSRTTMPPLFPDAVMAPFGDQIVLVGGSPSQTWTWNGTAWNQLDVPGPTPRGYASLAALGNQLVLFGGEVGDGQLLSDTWTWNGSAWMQLAPAGPVPSPRMSASIAAVDGALVLFGGWDPDDDALSDTWTWDGQVWTPHDVIGPTERAEGLMVVTSSTSMIN